MPLIPFGEWLPDVAALGSPGALRAANCFPGPTGYKPAKSLQVTTNALAARARGAISAKDKAGTVYQFAGAASKLYQLVDQTWTDVSKSGGYAAGTEEICDFVRWKNKIIATDYTDAIQQIEMAAALFSDLTTDFKARRLAVVRDFVVAVNTNDATDGAVPNRGRWGAADTRRRVRRGALGSERPPHDLRWQSGRVPVRRGAAGLRAPVSVRRHPPGGYHIFRIAARFRGAGRRHAVGSNRGRQGGQVLPQRPGLQQPSPHLVRRGCGIGPGPLGLPWPGERRRPAQPHPRLRPRAPEVVPTGDRS